uniref:Ig-like domain-containing protein n=1 Tax=Sinocyclocheilus rhinocerous TaxID=307959 RepID=A0A673N240_9TELE
LNLKSDCLIIIIINSDYSINQPTRVQKASEHEMVKLHCTYSTNSLQWYRQYPGSAPQFLVFSTKLRKEKQSTKETNSVDLIISSAAVSDSALYYCALRPTITGNTRTLYKNLT